MIANRRTQVGIKGAAFREPQQSLFLGLLGGRRKPIQRLMITFIPGTAAISSYNAREFPGDQYGKVFTVCFRFRSYWAGKRMRRQYANDSAESNPSNSSA